MIDEPEPLPIPMAVIVVPLFQLRADQASSFKPRSEILQELFQ